MDESSAYKEVSPILSDIPRFEGAAEPVDTWRPAPQPLSIPRTNLILFLLTLLTTTMAGADASGAFVTLRAPLQSLLNLGAGLSYSIPLMAILLAHELGHYFAARRHGVEATPPYFIPAPFPSLFIIGTFGAFIRMKTSPRTRRAMFEIGAAGPWAGFAVALLAVILGLELSKVTPLDASAGGINLGNSLLFWSVSRVILGVDPNTVNVDLHPIAFAGWLGLFVTTLNLLPVGQLDGGHVVYSLLGGRVHRMVSRLCWAGCALMVVVPYALGYDFWLGWLLWFVLVFFLGLGHPSTVDAHTPLTGNRRTMAWATVALFILTFSPVPFSFVPPGPAQSQPQIEQQAPSQTPGISVMLRLPAASPGATMTRGLIFRS
ncbi:MAG: site-2 protease family protein [Candidatus Binataceae bacterium]|jgi:membrane-associated protease RseP (regulator of RpoE activity)